MTNTINITRLGPCKWAGFFFFLPLLLWATLASAGKETASLDTQIHSLEGKWSFKTDPYKDGMSDQWWEADLDTASWDEMQVPGVWDTYDQYHDYAGDAWYRLQFASELGWPKKRLRLVFDSVYHDAEVWLNGERLGENSLGFLSFRFDVSDKIKKRGRNTLVVRVNNEFKRGAVWNWGGIRRPVYLEVTPKARVERVYIQSEPNLETGTASLFVRTRLSSAGAKLRSAFVHLNITNEGEVVYQQSLPVDNLQGEEQSLEVAHSFELPAELVKLWHFNDPNLYTAEATLSIDDRAVHRHAERFGIRKVEVDGEDLLFNGEKVRLVGFNIVPEDRYFGNSLPMSRIKQDVDLLKSLNANFSRLSGQPLPKPYLDYMDEVGIMTFAEVGVWGKDKLVDPDHPLPKEWLDRMMDERYNHPSVVGWNVGNEIGYLEKNPRVREYVKAMTERARSKDPSRLAVLVSNSAHAQANDPSEFSDLVMFNKYNNHEKLLKQVHEHQKGRAIFYSEIGQHLDSEDPGLSTLDPEELIGALRKYPYLSGVSLWTFSDYRSNWLSTSPGWSTPASENRSWGVVSIYRTPKRSFHRFKEFFAPVESMELSKQQQGYRVSLMSRSMDTFPAFTLNDYRLVWTAQNHQGQVLDAQVTRLPEIKPGDGLLEDAFIGAEGAALVRVDLIDPAGYSVLSASDVLERPVAPSVRAMHTTHDTARVVYNRVPLADEYQAVAVGPDGERIEGVKTINDFSEITGLTPETTYRFSVEAINSQGRSDGKANERQLTMDQDELPPVIWDAQGIEDAFFIGYSSDITDYRYEIQYGLASGQYDKQHFLHTHGSTRIPALEPGADHYFRLRRVVTGSVASEWTDEHHVSLSNDDGLPAPEKIFAVRGDSGLVIGMEPVQGSAGYRLTAQTPDGEVRLDSGLAWSNFLVIENEAFDKASKISIQTLDNENRAGPARGLQILK